MAVNMNVFRMNLVLPVILNVAVAKGLRVLK